MCVYVCVNRQIYMSAQIQVFSVVALGFQAVALLMSVWSGVDGELHCASHQDSITPIL